MKILYEGHYVNNLKSFSEVFSISANYKRIQRDGYLINRNIVLSFLLYFLVSTILAFVYLKFIFIEKHIETLAIIFSVLFTYIALVYFFALLGFFSQYSSLKKHINSDSKKNTKKKKNTLTIDEEGIKDNTNVICISSKWDNINCVVIGKYSICVLTEALIYYTFPTSIKNKLLSGIDKYNTNKDIKIIDTYVD
jgi:hypothetical protein